MFVIKNIKRMDNKLTKHPFLKVWKLVKYKTVKSSSKKVRKNFPRHMKNV